MRQWQSVALSILHGFSRPSFLLRCLWAVVSSMTTRPASRRATPLGVGRCADQTPVEQRLDRPISNAAVPVTSACYSTFLFPSVSHSRSVDRMLASAMTLERPKPRRGESRYLTSHEARGLCPSKHDSAADLNRKDWR
ncbi:hypothetical protein HDK77DRAFT_278850 [Phyllosticta capitalensis]